MPDDWHLFLYCCSSPGCLFVDGKQPVTTGLNPPLELAPRPRIPPITLYPSKFTGNACTAAREMEGRRFLSSAAPRLPLPDCDVLDCGCKFAHHPDRRAKQDRRSPFRTQVAWVAAPASTSKSNVNGKDRRQNDDEDFLLKPPSPESRQA